MASNFTHSRRIRRATTGESWVRRPRRPRTRALRRQISRSRGSCTQRSVSRTLTRFRESLLVWLISSLPTGRHLPCGSLLFVLFVSSALPTDASRAYCQLWMGMHPMFLSKLRHSCRGTWRIPQEEPRATWLAVGWTIYPSCFKELAIRKALSIQSHPDKKSAERLHAVAPNLYKGMPPHSHTKNSIPLSSPTMNRPKPQTRNGHRVDTVPSHVRLQRAT
jgi:hypothetical protein